MPRIARGFWLAFSDLRSERVAGVSHVDTLEGPQGGEPMSESTVGWRLSRKSALLALLCTSPLAFLVGHFGGFDRGFSAWAFGVSIVAACTLRWDLKSSRGFWVAVVALTLLHVPLVIWWPWRYSGAAYMPVCALDIAIDVGLVTLLAKLTPPQRGQGAVS